VSPDQLTYVLVALVVTGVAILLLLAGVLLARRGGRADRPATPNVMSAVPPAFVRPTPPVTAAHVPDSPARELEPAAPAPRLPGDEHPAAGPAPLAEPPSDEPLAVTAADRAAAARRVHDPREEEIIEGFLSISPRRREVVADEATRPPTAIGPAPTSASGGTPEMLSGAFDGAPGQPGDPLTDGVTGLDSQAAWDRAVAEENARFLRYRRPVSVVVGDVDGLARFEEQFGTEAAQRLLAAIAGTLRRGARRTDRVAHGGRGRFLVLMPETDEIQAINYVERVRGECERWLAAGATALRLSLGWASPGAVGELDTALRTAEERMYAERRRAASAATGEPGGRR
jgi:diguanylate cyclase (GGDEF)-like protein